jgi:hypothetical protein
VLAFRRKAAARASRLDEVYLQGHEAAQGGRRRGRRLHRPGHLARGTRQRARPRPMTAVPLADPSALSRAPRRLARAGRRGAARRRRRDGVRTRCHRRRDKLAGAARARSARPAPSATPRKARHGRYRAACWPRLPARDALERIIAAIHQTASRPGPRHHRGRRIPFAQGGRRRHPAPRDRTCRSKARLRPAARLARRPAGTATAGAGHRTS